MKKFYLCLLIAQCLTISAHAGLYNGYIITLNGIHLTGQIGEVYLADNKRQVVFINDLGTPYMISPILISGFAYKDGDQLVTYQSIVVEDSWAFLKIVCQGEGLSLMKSPDHQIEILTDAYGISQIPLRNNDYYMKLKRKDPVRIKRIGFRKQMRELVGKRAPELKKKIGTKGYRYGDIEVIALEYLDEYKTTRFIL